ncbi:MAG: hypothetical protein AAGH53_06395 [Pseudomonadota bacterium]
MTCKPAFPLFIAIVPGIVFLSGCAASSADFPELKRRTIEDLPVDGQPVAKDTGPEVVAMPAALRNEVDALVQDALIADNGFQSGVAKAQSAVVAGRAAGQNSENWVVAQTEVSALSTYHNRTVNLLSAIDALYIGETEKQYDRDAIYDLTPLINAQSKVQDIVARQRDLITRLDNRLR